MCHHRRVADGVTLEAPTPDGRRCSPSARWSGSRRSSCSSAGCSPPTSPFGRTRRSGRPAARTSKPLAATARHHRADHLERHDPPRRRRHATAATGWRCTAGWCSPSRSARCSSPTRSASSSCSTSAPSSSSYGSMYYVMTGFHALHVFAGLAPHRRRDRDHHRRGHARATNAGRRVGQLLLALRRRRVGAVVPDPVRVAVAAASACAAWRSCSSVCVPAVVVFAAAAVAGPGADPDAGTRTRRPRHGDPAEVGARARAVPHVVLELPRRGGRRHRQRAVADRRGCGGGRLPTHRPGACRSPIPSAQAVSKPPAFHPARSTRSSRTSRRSATGTPIPDVDPAAGDLAAGGTLFRLNCAACHSATGTGGALSYGDDAPKLWSATPLQIAEAMRTGPGQMPVFGPDTFSDHQVNSIVRYVRVPLRSRRPGRLLARAHRPDHGRHGRAPARDPAPAVRLPSHRGAP